LTCGFASYCAPVRLAQRSTVHNPLLAPSFDRYGWTRFAQFLLQRRALRACRQEILNRNSCIPFLDMLGKAPRTRRFPLRNAEGRPGMLSAFRVNSDGRQCQHPRPGAPVLPAGPAAVRPAVELWAAMGARRAKYPGKPWYPRCSAATTC
jgi:hypothetical protein